MTIRSSTFAVTFAVLATLAFSTGAHAADTRADSKTEILCSKTIAKGISKLHATAFKTVAKCRDFDISGKVDDPGLCDPLPEKSAARLASAIEKTAAKIAGKCQSVCRLTSTETCVSSQFCPPSGPTNQSCNGKNGTQPFDLEELGFPGPYCEDVLGRVIDDSSDIAECVTEATSAVTDSVVAHVYGGLDEAAGLDKAASKCLATLGKMVSKTSSGILKAVTKCRDTRNAEAPDDRPFSPEQCSTVDARTVASIAKAESKFDLIVDKLCDEAAIAKLDLCGNGIGGTDLAGAKSCLLDVARQTALSDLNPANRDFLKVSLLDIAYPNTAKAICGDGFVNQLPAVGRGAGEECDLDDTPCGPGGSCFPPGDPWECTCDNVPRIRVMIDGKEADSDAGWNGASHDATSVDGTGYVAELSGCDCDEMTNATCTGTTGDPVCNVLARTKPVCSNAVSDISCDDQGNGDGINTDADCFVCDANSANAGTPCADGSIADERLCDSQCFDSEGSVVGACDSAADCPEGTVCRGRCLSNVTCHVQQEGPPLPLVSASTIVCVQLDFFTDIVGTKNIVTGEEAVSFATRSNTALGDVTLAPCPTCQGRCIGGSLTGDPCQGRCDVSDDPCVTDSDCTGAGDTACLETSPDCPDDLGEEAPARCGLELVCAGGPNDLKECSPQGRTALGIVSGDCPPDLTINFTNEGVRQPFDPFTTEVVSHPAGEPCTAVGFENLTCPCPETDPLNPSFPSVPTQPNGCNPSCNAAPNLGRTCGSTAAYTRCDGGTNDNAFCDEDGDCPGGSCSRNPKICIAGNPDKRHAPCILAVNCHTPGMTDGVCADACPSGRCVAGCFPEGECDSGARAGLTCATNGDCDGFCDAGSCTTGSQLRTPCTKHSDCIGGGVCNVTDPYDGVCPGGPSKYRCSGDGFTTVPCNVNDEGTEVGCELGIDGFPGNADDLPGAGICVRQPWDCYANNGLAEGGDTLNGLGDPDNFFVVTAFCAPPNSNSAVNSASGLGGPSRNRRKGTVTANFSSIAP